VSLGVFALTVLASALAAPFYREEAIKFALRTVASLSLVPCVYDLARNQRLRIPLIACLLAGAAASAAMGVVADVSGAGLPSWLNAGHYDIRFDSTTRVQSTFDHPNTAAMYWEASLVAGIALLESTRIRRTLLVAAGLAVTATALVLTGSRGGVGGAIVGLAIVIWLSARLRRRRLASSAAAVAVSVLLMTVVYYIAGAPLLRLVTENTSNWYGAAYSVPVHVALPAGSRGVIPVTVTNIGLLGWRATGPYSVELSYHIADAGGDRLVKFEGERTSLPHDVTAGSDLSILASVAAPIQPGQYTIVWDIVENDVTWFISRGVAPARTHLDVTPSQTTTSVASITPEQPGLTISGLAATPVIPGRLLLWQAAARMLGRYPLLGVGPGNFRLLYGQFLGEQLWDKRIHSNSLYVETAATSGVVGLLGLLVVLCIAVGSQLRRWTAKYSAVVSEPDLWSGLCVLGAVAAFLAHGLVDYFFGFISTDLLFWVLLGLGAALSRVDLDSAWDRASR
jgi:O-antigen ligase